MSGFTSVVESTFSSLSPRGLSSPRPPTPVSILFPSLLSNLCVTRRVGTSGGSVRESRKRSAIAVFRLIACASLRRTKKSRARYPDFLLIGNPYSYFAAQSGQSSSVPSRNAASCPSLGNTDHLRVDDSRRLIQSEYIIARPWRQQGDDVGYDFFASR